MASKRKPSGQQLTCGELIRRARNRQGLTQEQLAAKIGRHVTTVQNLEGNRSNSRSTVEAVAAALKTTTEALGFKFPKPIRPSDLTPDQREVLEEILALPAEDLAAVRQALRQLEAKRRRKTDR